MAALVRSLQGPFCVLDLDGRIAEVNEQFCAMVGYDAQELVGSVAPYAFWPAEQLVALTADTERALRERGRFEVVLCRRGGERFAAVVDVTGLAAEEGGTAYGMLCVCRDVSLEVAERDRLRHAHDVARLVTWDWDPVGDRVERPYGGIVGVETGIAEGVALSVVLAHVAEPFRGAVEQGLRAAAVGEAACVLQYPLVGAGPAVWVETRADGGLSASASLLMRASTQDISELRRAREDLDVARIFWQSALGSLPDHVAVLEADGVIVAVNDAWTDFAAAHGEDGIGVGANYLAECDAQAAAGDPHAPLVAAGLRGILGGEEGPFLHEYRSRGAADDEQWFALRASRFRGPGPDRIVVQREEITDARRATADIRTQARLLDAVDASVIATTLDAHVTHWNQGAERLYGWTAAEAMGQPITSLTIGEPSVAALKSTREAAAAHGYAEAEMEVRHKAGVSFPVYVRTALLVDDVGKPAGLVSVSVDISQRVEAERQLRSAESYLRAVTDSMGEGLLTLDGDGRLTYMNRAAENVLGWRRAEDSEQHGHASIDYAGSGGEPFAPTMGLIGRARNAGDVVHVDDDVFTRSDGTEVPVSHTSSPFTSSEGHAGWVVVFSDISTRKAEQERVRRRLETLSWVDRIRSALAGDGFRLSAQPIVEIASGRVVQHELLVRMLGDDGLLIPPGQFLPAAEQSGLIRDIDRWVLDRGIRLAGAGHAVHINVSGSSIGDAGLYDAVRESLRAANADPALVVFELTETAVLENEGRAKAFIDRVSELGCRVALDDFGTGYAGFTYLKRLPVHYLKIDREFVRDLLTNTGSEHVVRAIIALARGFGLKTVAEGIEHRDVLGLLGRLGVDYGQGYALGRPRPVETVFGETFSAEDGA
jgi:PAS domain S-box-containing protein